MNKKNVLPITADYFLNELHVSDKEQLVFLMNDKGIYDNTLKVPHPYGIDDAETWLEIVYKKKLTEPIQTEWVIRDKEGLLIGGIGLVQSMIDKPHKNELGYWLGRPYWGKGIMTEVVKKLSDHLLANTDLVRLEAHVFAHNFPSMKVLEKAGFKREGILRKNHKKNDTYLDGFLYAKLDD